MDSKLIVSLYLLSVTVAENFQRTIVVIEKPTKPTQTVFLRGGDALGKGIPIRYMLDTYTTSSTFVKSTGGDTKLDWHGREDGQTSTAHGSPMKKLVKHPKDYLAVNINGAGFFSVKTVDAELWIAEFEMDCDRTTDGWFEYKGFLTDRGVPSWEGTLTHDGWEQLTGPQLCTGESFPHGETFQTGFNWATFKNHFGKCGSFNFVSWSKAVSCTIHPLYGSITPITVAPLGP